MIIVNPNPPPQFAIVSSARPFDSHTCEVAVDFAGQLSWLGLGNASEQDLHVALHGRSGMQLCHQVSYAHIERMVLEYLNGAITLNRFMILCGSVMRPSWNNLLFPQTLKLLLVQWATSFCQRLDLMVSKLRGDQPRCADIANHLVRTLNNAIPNLRYGHASTNMSIGSGFDLRLQNGFTLDPYMLFSILMAGGSGVLSAESSAALNDWESQAVAVCYVPGGAVKSSESSTIVSRTQRTNNPIMGRLVMPERQWWRGSACIWMPISNDTLALLIACVFIYFFYIRG